MDKECNMCGLLKPYEQFSKNRSAKDGLQRHCKTCSQKQSKKFRKINKDYYWGDNGYFRRNYEEILNYNQRYYNAHYPIKIYLMELPEGFYIGCTKTRINVRIKDHLSDYRHYRLKKGEKKMPLLYDALDKYTLKEVRQFIRSTKVIEEFEGDHQKKFEKETYWIQHYKNLGKNMLNKIKVDLEIKD